MVQSSGPIKSMLSAFKRGSNSSKTPGKLAATGSGDSIASSGLGRRLFSFSPAKPPNSSRKLRPPVSDEPADLIPVGIQPIAAASTTPGLGSLSEDASIKVVVRIRPRNDREASLGGAICVQPLNASSLRLGPPAEPHSFSFDHVAQEAASQEDVFNVAGRPVVDSCLQGFNGCLLAYGQTGSGKTYSMLGPCDDTVVAHDHRRGLIQRIFEHLFATLAQQADPSTQTSVTCSFLEIYNETISDLLCPGPSALALREDARRGIFVEGLTEEKVASVEDVVGLLQEGVLNRRVGETQMNERSSRSHSVFTAVVERRTPGVNGGAAKILRSRLHLVDLAGSERQKTSGAAGERLKEASSINKSLSTLGLVIMSLVDQQQGRQRHVPYRDSKLTFLLQDSLGGNAKTVLVAAISPAAVNAAETLSTLRFADGAKRIKNKATVNEDSEGDVEALRCEIRKLKEELTLARQSQAQPVTPVRGPSRLGNSPMQAAVPMSTGAHAAGGEGARRALMGALRREEAAAAEVAALQEQMEGMRALVAAKDSDLKRTQMMLKLKESRLAQGNRGPGAESEVVAALQQEIDLLKAKVEAHPEVKRFALENLHLSQEVARLQGVVDRNELSALSADVTALRREILGMAEAVEAAQESAELASAEAHTARSVREALEGQLREAQAALAGREAVEGLQEQMEALKAEADELRLAVMAAETFKADAARMTTHAAELEAECERLKAALACKSTEAEEADTAYKNLSEQLAASWEEVSSLEEEVSRLSTALEQAYATAAAQQAEHAAAQEAADERMEAAMRAKQKVHAELAQQAQQASELGAQLEAAMVETAALRAALAGIEAKLEAERATVLELEGEVNQERIRATEAEEAVRETVAKLNDTETAKAAVERELDEALKAVETARQHGDAQAAQLEVVSAQLSSTKEELATSTATVAKLQEDAAASARMLAAATAATDEARAEVQRLQASVTATQDKVVALEEQLSEMEDSKAELAYELSDKSASLAEAKERLAALVPALDATKEAKCALERRKAELKTELEAASMAGAVAERERASLANRVRQLEELLDEARAKVAAAGKGPLEQEQQLLLVKAELKEAYSQVTKAQETAAKLSGALKEKDEEVARLRSAIAAEVNDAAQQVQELLAAQARSEQLEARVAELTGNVQKAPVQSWEGFHVMQ